MRCFACDKPVDARKSMDAETGRWYCEECFEPTNEVKLKYLLDELDPFNFEDPVDNVLDTLVDNTVDSDVFEYRQVSGHSEGIYRLDE